MNVIAKFKRLFTRVALYGYYLYRNKFSRSTLGDPDSDVIISLTTFKGRVDTVYLTIESLFDQQCRSVKRIVLWLSLEEFPSREIPNSLKRLEKRGLIVAFVEGNVKSYKKLIYAYKSTRDGESIITVDDDIFYPQWWLGIMLKKSREYPGSVVCYRGHFLVRMGVCGLAPYEECTKKQTKSVFPSFSLLPTGVGGVLYPKNSLNKQVENIGLFSQLCPNADDVWFKAVTLLTNTQVVRVFPDNANFLEVPNTQAVGLFKSNLDLSQNDVQLKKVFDYFDLYEKIC